MQCEWVDADRARVGSSVDARDDWNAIDENIAFGLIESSPIVLDVLNHSKNQASKFLDQS